MVQKMANQMMNIERKLIEDLHAHEECPVEFIDHLRRALDAKSDQKDDDQAFQLKDREGSRRDWFEEAQGAEKRVEELRAEVKRLDLMGAESDYKYDQRYAQFERVLAERDALLEEFATELTLAITDSQVRSAMTSVGRSKIMQLLKDYNVRIDAALSASAEPSAPKCGQCGARTVETCNDNGCAYFENGNGAPVERDLDDDPFFVQQAEPHKPVPNPARDERAGLETWQKGRDGMRRERDEWISKCADLQARIQNLADAAEDYAGEAHCETMEAVNALEQLRAALDKSTEGASHE
jgi:hypothetical protein